MTALNPVFINKVLENPSLDHHGGSSSSISGLLQKCSLFLGGFAPSVRFGEGQSERLYDPTKLYSRYYHPARRIEDPDGRVIRFDIRHDMYSLGVVLLQIGMWLPLERISTKVAKALDDDGADLPKGVLELRDAYIDATENCLPGMVGSKYASAVMCCLKDSTVRTDATDREMREMFYEDVLHRLKQISV